MLECFMCCTTQWHIRERTSHVAQPSAPTSSTAANTRGLDALFAPRGVAILGASSDPTKIGGRPLRNTARVARNEVSVKVVDMLNEGAQFEDVRDLVAGVRGREVYESGDLDAGIWSVGMVQGLIQDVPSASELVERMVAGAEEIINGRLKGFIA